MITDLGDKKLTTDNEDYWIAPDANVIGSVHLSKDASVWFNTGALQKENIVNCGYEKVCFKKYFAN